VKLLLNATIVEMFDSHLSNKTNNIWGLLDQTAIFTVSCVHDVISQVRSILPSLQMFLLFLINNLCSSDQV